MKIEIPFDEKVYRKQTLLYFELLFREGIEKTNIALLFAILGLLISSPIVLLMNFDLGNFCIFFFTLLYFFLVLSQKIKYNKLEKGYHEKIDLGIEKNSSNTIQRTFEFNQDFIRWRDENVDLKFNWEILKNIKIIDETIFFNWDNSLALIIISKYEIGEENYTLLLNNINNQNV